MASFRRITLPVALAVAAGAILLSSCREQPAEVDPAADEAMMTEYSEDLTIIESENGRRSYCFTTPLVEGYSQAREPYREFRKGIRMVTYQDDSLSSVDVVLTANYAIYYEKRKLWEAKGNVVVEKYDGKKLYTQQLFWNAMTKKVYSNVDTRVVQEGRSDILGAGFESDEEFKDWRFRYMKGRTEVDVTPRETPDSTRQSAAAEAPAAEKTAAGKAAAATPAATAPAAEKPRAGAAASRPAPASDGTSRRPAAAPAGARNAGSATRPAADRERVRPETPPSDPAAGSGSREQRRSAVRRQESAKPESNT